jgi:hypothetical protein
VSGSNQVSIRDTNIYVRGPASGEFSSGSFVGIETNDIPGGYIPSSASIQVRNSSISGPPRPTSSQSHTASDILQTSPLPADIDNPSYLASPGIQIGPGTDLVTKSAGGLPFSTYTYPTTLYYGLRGTIHSGSNGYLWPGTQSFSNQFPDITVPAAYYKVQQPVILSGMNVRCNVAPGMGRSLTITIRRTPITTYPSTYGTIANVPGFTLTLSNTTTDLSYYASSQDFQAGDLLHVQLSYDGNNSNDAQDISVQLDMF